MAYFLIIFGLQVVDSEEVVHVVVVGHDLEAEEGRLLGGETGSQLGAGDLGALLLRADPVQLVLAEEEAGLAPADPAVRAGSFRL